MTVIGTWGRLISIVREALRCEATVKYGAGKKFMAARIGRATGAKYKLIPCMHLQGTDS